MKGEEGAGGNDKREGRGGGAIFTSFFCHTAQQCYHHRSFKKHEISQKKASYEKNMIFINRKRD